MADNSYEHKTEAQVNINFGETFNLTKPVPLISKRIFKNFEHAKQYVENRNDSAVEGLILSIVSDEDKTKNGIYQVVKVENNVEGKNNLGLKSFNNDGKIVYIFSNGLEYNENTKTVSVKINKTDPIFTDNNSINHKTNEYMDVNNNGIMLNIGKISNSSQNNRYLLDSYDTKEYIDNYDVGTF